ncbi:plasminogen-like [Mercenaria mercenaria]|uniref:plasminogen-like n=1 Tax=Mercenaria mercenaria TaxID=6596 RepID=UPI00234F8947|nr:plasminogen-like [Mercenaria mercenaria]
MIIYPSLRSALSHTRGYSKMAGLYIWILTMVLLASITEILCGYENKQKKQATVFPCRSDRTTRCPPGFRCCEVSDGLSECLRTRKQRKCFDVGFAHIYKGYQTKTINGKICQRWDSQTPHKPSNLRADNFPDNTIQEAKNYCRDPHKEGRPWCYTTDPNDRWDYCDVPECTKQDDCYKYGFVKQYKGFKRVTKDNVQCQRWDAQSPHKHKYTNPDDYPDASLADASNYCRSPEGSRPWCYTTGSKRWDYCDVEICTFDFCHDDKSWKYRGFATRTQDGLECQRWDSQSPHTHKYGNMPMKFPEATVSEAENYCRDPSWSGYTWCYTTDPNIRWQKCNVKKCRDI